MKVSHTLMLIAGVASLALIIASPYLGAQTTEQENEEQTNGDVIEVTSSSDPAAISSSTSDGDTLVTRQADNLAFLIELPGVEDGSELIVIVDGQEFEVREGELTPWGIELAPGTYPVTAQTTQSSSGERVAMGFTLVVTPSEVSDGSTEETPEDALVDTTEDAEEGPEEGLPEAPTEVDTEEPADADTSTRSVEEADMRIISPAYALDVAAQLLEMIEQLEDIADTTPTSEESIGETPESQPERPRGAGIDAGRPVLDMSRNRNSVGHNGERRP